ncbi:MAG: 3-deoxy-7-phosphoheptulonate synthase [Planctomycetota bacterium]|jgi:3-deoxy-7-phosphoheptulonate synthase
MIVVMKSGATDQQIHHVVDLIHDFGLTEHVIAGPDHTIIAAIGDKRSVDRGAIETAPMVDRIMLVQAPYKMASREVKPDKTVIAIGPSAFPLGGPQVGVIAGPCAVESRDQLLRIADLVKDAGCIGLRGGAFKPRTSPYSFQGLQEEGLAILDEARSKTGLAIVTEVISPDTLPAVQQVADVLQVGARNMQNYRLLETVGQATKPVLLKRGMSATLEEWLLAAEYVINGGNANVILCERGIRTYESYVRNTLPLAVVPELIERTHLPIVVDPSHGTGRARLVPAMCRAALAAGADGLLLECHIQPERALSDGAQSLSPTQLVETMTSLKRVAEAVGRSL